MHEFDDVGRYRDHRTCLAFGLLAVQVVMACEKGDAQQPCTTHVELQLSEAGTLQEHTCCCKLLLSRLPGCNQVLIRRLTVDEHQAIVLPAQNTIILDFFVLLH